MRTSNPTLNQRAFQNLGYGAVYGQTMTIDGTVNKTGFLLILLTLSAAVPWTLFFAFKAIPLVMLLALIGLIGGLITGLVTVFKKDWSMITAPLYACFEGLLLGSISAIFERSYPGIAIQAVGLTFGTLCGLLLAYRSGMIKVTENFKMGVIAATFGICLMYMVSFVLSLFGIRLGFIHGNGLLSIGISLVVVGVAALNLVLDFDFIENAARQGAPKYMEWYSAYGLLVTLVWLYLEILRLLSKLRSRD